MPEPVAIFLMRSRVRRAGLAALLCLLAITLVGIVYKLSESSGVRALHRTASQRLEVYSGSLLAEMSRYDYLPALLGLNPDIAAALLSPRDAPAVDRADRYLATVATNARASAIYVMTPEGMTVAASNWQARDSFVGMNFSFRPYFIDAMREGVGRFYGVGTVSREPGYYFSSSIYAQGQLVGVVAVKVALHSLDTNWKNAGEIVVAADENDVIFLSSMEALKFRTLSRLSGERLKQLEATRQYNTLKTLEPLGPLQSWTLLDGTVATHVTSPSGTASAGRAALTGEYLVEGQLIPGTPWKLLMLSELADVKASARNAAAAACFAALAVVALLVLGLQRRRVAVQAFSSKAALEQAYGDLENQVRLRTHDLSDANTHLHQEVFERRKTEQALKDTLEELVQAGKMAALGQMATGITHELNQPLAALRTLSDNASVLLNRGRVGEAQVNLQEISQLVARMGKITAELKNFARKTPPRMEPVSLDRVVADALSLLDRQLRIESVELRLDVPERTMALADANRLQQVLVNLIANAIDAMTTSTRKLLTIGVVRDGTSVSIAVRDTGAGMSSESERRLFEPFYTTKAQGSGLGLGLAISADIVRGFGGTLSGRNLAPAGAEFTVQLTAAQDIEIHA
jgi:two-component system C4-dicarboxylate transport sensor histidine kinase DctB